MPLKIGARIDHQPQSITNVLGPDPRRSSRVVAPTTVAPTTGSSDDNATGSSSDLSPPPVPTVNDSAPSELSEQGMPSDDYTSSDVNEPADLSEHSEFDDSSDVDEPSDSEEAPAFDASAVNELVTKISAINNSLVILPVTSDQARIQTAARRYTHESTNVADATKRNGARAHALQYQSGNKYDGYVCPLFAAF